jgi:RNA polymerase sigma factor (sigma-70 family)
MDPDTDIGGPLHKFPVTNHSAIAAARSDDQLVRRRAFDTILASYWKPAYKYIRFKWQADNEDAKDLTQGFFANAFEKNHFAGYDAAKASFQTFLRTCLDSFVSNERKAGRRLKRGGDVDHYQLDFVAAEAELAAHTSESALSPEDYFHREWVRWMFTMAVDALRRSCDEAGRMVHFQLFERYDLRDDADVSYASLAREFGLEPATVNNYLAAARREFRKIVLEKLREITATDEEFRTEARSLLGINDFTTKTQRH